MATRKTSLDQNAAKTTVTASGKISQSVVQARGKPKRTGLGNK